MTPPVIAVLGATGMQGGGVVAALQKQGKFGVRAITRNAQKAKALADQGVEVVEADMNNKESLKQAFKGATGLFLLTDFYGCGFSPEAELQQGKNAVDAAKEAGVKHIVLSTLEDPSKVLPKGTLPELEKHPGYVVAHFQSKAAVQEYLEASGVPWAGLRTCAFYDNFAKLFFYQRQPDGSRTWSDNLGTAPLQMHAVADIGESAALIFADPKKYAGQVIPVAREAISWTQVAEILTEVTGTKVRYVQISDEEYASMPFPAADDLAAMWRYYRVGPKYNELRDPKDTIYQGPTFKEWALEQREALTARVNQ